VTHLGYDSEDDVWQGTFAVPAGAWEYKAALDDSWTENYGAGGVQDGPNIPLNLGADTDVKFYYDHETHWVTDNVNSVIATVPGSFQAALGCSGDWQPDCLRSWLQDVDGDGLYQFSTDAIPAGSYEAKITHNESWDENYGAGGVPNGPNIPFTVLPSETVTFDYDPVTHILTITNGPGDASLARPPVRTPFSDEVFYFVLPDRFDNGDPSNDAGGITGGVLDHGFEPTNKGYYHGGDLAGLQAKLDYLQSLGVTAIWMTPQFTNRPVWGDGTIGFSSAAYHGYWQVDYTQIDPHFGSNAEMQAFIADAHGRGMKVFFDIVINHTADVISFEEGFFAYRNKADYPYRDADGIVFDDRDYAGTGTFPPLDPAVSFPYTPMFPSPGDATAKNPAWLNDPVYYHNRGDSTFSGENSLYGDFFGLDDLFTEHPDVVTGMIDVHKDMITDFDVDGFRVDTVKQVNDELWQEFVPAILAHAESLGKTHFVLFGEVFHPAPAFLGRYTTELPFQSVLGFGFDATAREFAAAGAASEVLRGLFEEDDQYTDADGNAHGLVKFVGNHDLGRLGYHIDSSYPGAPDAERVARSELAHALMFFSRGVPLIYYGDEQGFTGDGGDKDARQDMMPSLVPSYNDDDLIGTSATTADANFDPTHPLYQTFTDLASVRDAHLALRQGAQLHRHSEGGPGIYAFSRIERGERIEYLVALNNAESGHTATFPVGSPLTTFAEIYPGGGPALSSDGGGVVTVFVPALDLVIYRADTPMPDSPAAPGIAIVDPVDGAEVTDRFEVRAELDPQIYAEVTFAVSVDGGPYETVGTDDNAPYRVFFSAGDVPNEAQLRFKAVVDDLAGHFGSDEVTVVASVPEPPPPTAKYAIIHYFRDDGDYGDHTTGDSNDYWGLHLWGDIEETIDWTSPKPFLGEDEYGRFAWVQLAPDATNVGFIVHRGDTKDGTDADRFFDPSITPEIWLRNDDAEIYASQAEAQDFVTIHYHRPDGDYGDPTTGDFNDFWGLHLWGDAIDPSEGTGWTSPKPFDGVDDYGAFWNVEIQDASQPVYFIIHRGDIKDPGPDQSFVPLEAASVWIQSGDETVFSQECAAQSSAAIHYHRPDGDYGDYTSSDFNDFWGMHVWDGALNPNPSWQEPVRPTDQDTFGPVFDVDIIEGAPDLAYIIHRGDEKDPGPDQFLDFAANGCEVWQVQGADPEFPYIYPLPEPAGGNPGNIDEQRAYWVSGDTIAWSAGATAGATFALQYAPDGGLEATADGIIGGSSIPLLPDPLGLPADVQAKFPHLASLPALKIESADLAMVPEILKGQIAVSAVAGDGLSIDATGLQIPGVLDDLYTYGDGLGVGWETGQPTVRVWAPTAKSVTLHLFEDADPATPSTTQPMTWDDASGVWSVSGDSSWNYQYYLFEIEVYVHGTAQVETNLVTDPYSLGLAMNSTRSQILDLSDPMLQPMGWDELEKPGLAAPEDISIYEIHVRDFSVNDPSVPEEFKGTYKAFTLSDAYGIDHLGALQEAGLTHLHLLPVFDFAVVNENKAEWQAPDPAVLGTYPPDSDQQQDLVTMYEDADGFDWGYDPFHFTTPEGSYATDPDGATRIVEFREMVQALNQMGLRVVMDVVYNHTSAAGQDPRSVLDRIVPGYYHRLNDRGQVETSTCCPNTASEHAMMEKLMIDSLVTWAVEYKVDAFRFDLMGHHMVSNMENVRMALDGLTMAEHGVDGSSVYIYGEGWNFGEVADNFRGVNATQLNLGGTGIGTFNDRLRDAVRGGGRFDSGDDLVRRQGFANGLFYDPNALNSGSPDELDTLLLLGDRIRVGMAGNLADYEFTDRNGNLVRGADVDYNGQPAGYTEDPQEDISYISNHDNQTLHDINTYKAPIGTSMADRVRIQNVALSTVLLGQGVPFMHAGSDLLRSKSFDRDSFNSGDWFNRLDFTYQANNFGVGLPLASRNQDNWSIMQPLLADPLLMPGPGDIGAAADGVRELLQIRSSSELFRLETAAEIQARVAFHNTGPTQIPGLIVMSITDDEGAIDRTTERLVTIINASDAYVSFPMSELIGLEIGLHPVQESSTDPIVRMATFDGATGTFGVPARTAAVFVGERSPEEQGDLLIGDVEDLVADGVLNHGQGNALISKLERIQDKIARGQINAAMNQLEAFIHQVEDFVSDGILTAEQGAALIAAAEDIIAFLDG
jgi:pullulanase-type alpha-1,6-glucosidase